MTTQATTQEAGARDRRSGLLLALALGAALAAVVALAGTAEAAFPGASGRIAFASDRTTGPGVDNPTGDSEIFTMKPDGTGVRQLTFNTTFDGQPSFAADGSVMVFASHRDQDSDHSEIYVMDADGSNQTRLTNNSVDDLYPTLSPNGFAFAYQSIRGGNSEIIVQAGGFEANLTNNLAYDSSPVFSPDGSKIAFESHRDGNFEVYVMDADGANPKNLSNNPEQDTSPDWSPDGKRIAFESNRKSSSYEIYSMNALDGSGRVRLTRNAAADVDPVFSPGGRKIAFASGRDGDFETFVMKTNGEEQKRRTTNAFQDYSPDWQPLAN